MTDKFRPIAILALGLAIVFSLGQCADAVTTMAPWIRQESKSQDPDAVYQIAQTAATAQENADYTLAAQQWEKLLTDYPESSLTGKAHYNAGRCYVQTRQFQSAIDHLQKSLSKLGADETQKLPEAFLYLGYAQYQLGLELNDKQDEASKKDANVWLTTSTQTFANLLQKFPEHESADQACYFQGSAFESLRRLENAAESYEKMLTYPKQTFKFDGLFAIANVYEQLGKFGEALKYYDQFRADAKAAGGNPMLDDVNFHAAKTLMGLALAAANRDKASANISYRNAAEIFAALASQEPAGKSAESLAIADESQFQYAFCLTQLGEFENAGQVYEKVAARPESAFKTQSLVYAGRAFTQAGKNELAIAALKKAVENESPYAIEGALSLSGIYLKSGQPQACFDIANQWIEKTPESPLLPGLMMDRADAVYQLEGRRAESAQLFLDVADKFPKHELAPSATYQAAYTYLETNELDRAIATAGRFEKEFPTSDFLPDALEVKADSLLLNNNSAESEKVFEQLATAFPNHEKSPRWILRTGLSKYLQKKYQETIDLLEPKLDLFKDAPQRAEAFHWIGSSQFYLDQFEPAAQSLQKALDADKQWRRADETLLTLSQALFKNNAIDQAKSFSQQLINDYPDSPLAGDAVYFLGERAFDASDFELAFQNFKTVIDKYPDSRLLPHSLYSAAWSKQELKQNAESDELFSRLIKDFPDHEMAKRALIGRGASRRNTGNMAESIADLQAFLATNPTGQSKFNALNELGLAQVDGKKWPEAITTFEQLLKEDANSTKADRYQYELAWALQSSNQPDKALEYFASIATNTPTSSFAPEANFHVGSAAYQLEKYDDAIQAFAKCVAAESTPAADSVREKALYKLGWAHYKQDQFEDASKQFARQIELFPTGELYADGSFMVAESQFRLKNHEQALTAYLVAKPAVDAAGNVEPKIKLLTMLHGAQSANKTGKFAEALQLITPLTESESELDVSFKPDAWLEIGTAQEGLGKSDEAVTAWRNASSDLGKTGARARCMIGDVFFRQKKFTEAITEFKLVYYGFGGIQSADEVKPWQAYALYEAARCNFVQVEKAPTELKPKLIEEAIKQFDYLITNYQNDRLAPEAKKQLEALKKLQSN